MAEQGSTVTTNARRFAGAEFFFLLMVAFLGGAAAADFSTPFWVVVLLACGCAACSIRASQSYAAGITVIAGALFGIFYFHLYFRAAAAFEKLPTGWSTFAAVVQDEPRAYQKSQSFATKLLPPYRGTIAVIAGNSPPVRYGDLLRFKGQIAPPEIPGTPSRLAFPTVEKQGTRAASPLREFLIGTKERMLGGFRSAIQGDGEALLEGITLGVRNDFTKEFRTAMAGSGTTHLVAVSGYNITVLAVAAGSLLGFWFSRRIALFLTALAIGVFVALVGAEASVVRAAVMGILALGASAAGRLYDIRNATALAATLMVMHNPGVFRADAGFALSFMSLLGVIYLAPVLGRLLFGEGVGPGFLNWRENFSLTLGAQLMVLPVIASLFGQFSAASLVANILVLPLIPLTMGAGFALGALSFISAHLGLLVGKIAALLLSYETGVIYLFGGMAFPAGRFTFSWFGYIAYYALIAVFIRRYRRAQQLT